jgi:hypothetical protein
MAERRMFAKSIIDSDAFLDMPVTTQNLYFHFGMRADDDGFIGCPKRIMSLVKSNDDDYKILIAKKFIIPFESGICVIKHWRINNFLRNDRHTDTNYIDEKAQLTIKENGAYSVGIPQVYPSGIPNRYTQAVYRSGIPMVYTGKDSIGKDSIEKSISPAPKEQKEKYGVYKNVKLSNEEYEKLIKENNGKEVIDFFSEYREYKGYKCKNDYVAIKKWGFIAFAEYKIKLEKIKPNMIKHKYTGVELNSLFADLDTVVFKEKR